MKYGASMRKGSKVRLLVLLSRSFLYKEYNGRIKERASHFWSMLSLARSALHRLGLLRHLASWPHGNKKAISTPITVITENTPTYFQIAPERSHYLFSELFF